MKKHLAKFSLLYVILDAIGHFADFLQMAESEIVSEFWSSQSFISIESGLIRLNWIVDNRESLQFTLLIMGGLLGLMLIVGVLAGEKTEICFFCILLAVFLTGSGVLTMSLSFISKPAPIAVVALSCLMGFFGFYIVRNSIVGIWRYLSFRPNENIKTLG